MEAKYGNIDTGEILPHATTTSRLLSETAEIIRKELIPILNKK